MHFFDAWQRLWHAILYHPLEHMMETVEAMHFHRYMTKSRTNPALCGCQREQGEFAGDFVVKLRGSMERRTVALISELVAARLASYFGIATPSPALVLVDAQLAEVMADRHPTQSLKWRNSIGLNFGSQLLTNAGTWPVDQAVSSEMLQAAQSIFAFDALIQIPTAASTTRTCFFEAARSLPLITSSRSHSSISSVETKLLGT